MDVASLATGLSQSKLATDVSYAVQRKALSAAKQEGAAVLALLQQAANIGKPGSVDPLSVAASGKGGQLDIYG